MKKTGKRRILISGVIMLLAGFLIGTIQYNYLTDNFASANNSKTYRGSDIETETEAPKTAMQTAENIEQAINYSARQVKPAVTTIFTRKRITRRHPFLDDPFFREFFEDHFEFPDRQRKITSLGSGMIIRSDGYILTNHHVIKDADEIEVQLTNGQETEAEVIATDPGTDLAVIKINMDNLPTVNFANSDAINIGQWAIAIGAPFQLESSVSVGHISATHRAVGTQRYEDFIQTDAAINRGNSGGPLLNIRGEVIGVNTMIMTEGARGYQGVSFAIASNMARRTADDLIEHGEVRRAWLGVMIQKLTPDMAEKFVRTRGVIIAEIVENSPAENAGLQTGDLIISVDDEPVASPHDLQRNILSYEKGDEVTVQFDRDGELKTTRVILDTVPDIDRPPRPDVKPEPEPELEKKGISGKMGLELAELDPETAAEKYEIHPPQTVLKIEKVEINSIAHQHTLRENALIIKVDRQDIEGLEEFNTYLKNQRAAGETSVLLLIKHNGSYIWQLVPLPD